MRRPKRSSRPCSKKERRKERKRKLFSASETAAGRARGIAMQSTQDTSVLRSNKSQPPGTVVSSASRSITHGKIAYLTISAGLRRPSSLSTEPPKGQDFRSTYGLKERKKEISPSGQHQLLYSLYITTCVRNIRENHTAGAAASQPGFSMRRDVSFVDPPTLAEL
jgi:hypothetical protein